MIVPGRVSVITACYNDGQWLRSVVESVREQTYHDVEHIIVDDGSTDPETISRLDELETEGVMVVRVPHGGLPYARNAGVEASSGEFIMPLDCDDLIDARYASSAVALFNEHPTAASVSPGMQVFGARDELVVPVRLDGGAALRDPSMVVATMIRRSAFDALGGYDETFTFAEDLELWIRLIHQFPNRQFLDEPMLHYRVRPGQMTQVGGDRRTPAVARAFAKNIEIFAAHSGEFMTYVREEQRFVSHLERRYAFIERVLGMKASWKSPN